MIRCKGEIKLLKVLVAVLGGYVGFSVNVADASFYAPTRGEESSYLFTKVQSPALNTISVPFYNKDLGVIENTNLELNTKKTEYGSGYESKSNSIKILPDYNVDFTAKYNTEDLKNGVLLTKNDKNYLEYQGTWVNLNTVVKQSYYLGGPAINNYAGKIGSIKGLFANNEVVTPLNSVLAWGGAVLLRNMKGGIYADFIGNRAVSAGESAGGAIAMATFSLDEIVGDFIGNYVSADQSVGWGGALYLANIPNVGLVKGNFISNYAYSSEGSAIGGGIEINWNAKITDVEGDFIANYALGGYEAIGGGIRNGGRIETIKGDFIANYVSSDLGLAVGGGIANYPESRTTKEKGIGEIVGNFYNNYAFSKENGALGGAIYNIEDIKSISSSFYGNYALSETGEAKGGAVWTIKDMKFVADNKDMVVAGNYTMSNGVKDDNAFWVDDENVKLDFELKGSGGLVLADNFDGAKGYDVNIFGDGKNDVYLFNDIRKADVGFSNIKLNTLDDKAHIYKINSLNLSGDVDFVGDVDFEKEQMDRFWTENGVVVDNGAKLNVLDLNWLNEPVKDKTSIMFAEKGLKDSVVYKGISKVVTPLYVYDITYNNNGDAGYFEFSRGKSSKGLSGFNPAVVGGGVSTNVGATGVLSQTLNYSFQNLDNYMNVPMGERIMLAYNLNRYETSMSAGEPLPSFMKENKPSVWVKPYVIDEDILLKNGAEISNKTYGTLVGYDTGVRKINASLDGAFTAYIGHSGATQEYDGVEAHQKGGLIGGTLSLYKGNFFSATTLSAGALDTESKSMFGKDDYTTLLAGVGNKTGYNFEFKGGKFIIQPSLMLAYSYINTEDYKNVLGVKVKNDAIHSLQISPGVRFIFNLSNGWKPYFEASKVWNVGERGQTSVDGVKLPSMYVKPYEQYGLGIQGHINSHIMLYGQTMIEDGGRDGVLVTGGFRWLF